MTKLRIEDYALIGDTHTAALVGRDGSIDWLCLPRFDSGACFAHLLGGVENGRWLLEPKGGPSSVRRHYREGTLILETEMASAGGTVRILDFMVPRVEEPDLVRIVEGVRGSVTMSMELVIRFDYGSVLPWVRKVDGGLRAVAGPDSLTLKTPVPTRGQAMKTLAEFEVREGQRVPFVLAYHPSHEAAVPELDAFQALAETEAWWRDWSRGLRYQGDHGEAVFASLRVLKALTYAPTGGIVAAPTTSLPESLGGVRNWDYRYTWLRDATFTLQSLLAAGCREEAVAWRDWLLRSVAGDPSRLQILYGVAGERRIEEYELPWLAGYAGSKPVRAGNAAVEQYQLDVYGELGDVMHEAVRVGLPESDYAWQVQRAILDFLEGAWHQPDDGIWEVRGPRRHFTHSKVMAWVAFDRAVRMIERFHRPGPKERFEAARDAIHREVLERGLDAKRNTFTQYYGSSSLDASLLRLPLVGFLPPTDPRILGTIAAVERELLDDGLVRRYHPSKAPELDGLPGREGVFLVCSFWLVDAYWLAGRREDARALYERLLALRNDVGLLAEEYDPAAKRQLGNFPQAFSHVGIVEAAYNLSARELGPAEQRHGR